MNRTVAVFTVTRAEKRSSFRDLAAQHVLLGAKSQIKTASLE